MALDRNKKQYVMIGGVRFNIVYVDDNFEKVDGMVDFHASQIKLSNELKSADMTENVLMHEIAYAMIGMMGYQKLYDDEVFVQGLANMFQQCFEIDFHEDFSIPIQIFRTTGMDDKKEGGKHEREESTLT